MEDFNINHDLSLKKWVLSIATVLLGFYVALIVVEDGWMESGVNYILHDTKEEQAAVDRVVSEYQAQFDRIEKGMKSISDDIKKGAETVNHDMERMQQEFEAGHKMIEERTRQFDQGWEAQRKLREKESKEISARWEREWKEKEEAMDRDFARREKKRIKELIASFQSSVECEKRVFGSSSLDKKRPEVYGQRGIENIFEQCKDLRGKKPS